MRHLDVFFLHMNIVCVTALGPISLIKFYAPFAVWIAYCLLLNVEWITIQNYVGLCIYSCSCLMFHTAIKWFWFFDLIWIMCSVFFLVLLSEYLWNSFCNVLQHGVLAHWGRVTHICVSKLTIIGSDNGLSPGRRQAIIWTNARILFIRTLGTNFSKIIIKIHSFSFKKMHLKILSAKGRLFSLGLNESNRCRTIRII